MFNDRDDYEILSREQIGDGGCNDNPDTVLQVRHLETDRIGWVAGPHGVDSCALGDWLASGDEPAETREAAIAAGCDETVPVRRNRKLDSMLPRGELTPAIRRTGRDASDE